MTCELFTQLHIMADLERYWSYKGRDVIVVLALSTMDYPPTYEDYPPTYTGYPPSSTDYLPSYTASGTTLTVCRKGPISISRARDLLAISTPSGTYLYFIPPGTPAIEIHIRGCSPVSIETDLNTGQGPSIQSRVSCVLYYIMLTLSQWFF